jgi:hypothetical protein
MADSVWMILHFLRMIYTFLAPNGKLCTIKTWTFVRPGINTCTSDFYIHVLPEVIYCTFCNWTLYFLTSPCAPLILYIELLCIVCTSFSYLDCFTFLVSILLYHKVWSKKYKVVQLHIKNREMLVFLSGSYRHINIDFTDYQNTKLDTIVLYFV